MLSRPIPCGRCWHKPHMMRRNMCWQCKTGKGTRMYLGYQAKSWDSPSASRWWQSSSAATLPVGGAGWFVTSILAPLAPRVGWSPLGRTGGAMVKVVLLLWGSICLQTRKGSCWHRLAIALLPLFSACGLFKFNVSVRFCRTCRIQCGCFGLGDYIKLLKPFYNR